MFHVEQLGFQKVIKWQIDKIYGYFIFIKKISGYGDSGYGDSGYGGFGNF